MDDRVYDVLICSECFTQVHYDGDGNPDICHECNSLDSTTIRFRVARKLVLKQAAPRQSLIERTVYFGAVGEAGHYYWERGRGGYPIKSRIARGEKDVTPWGYSVDGGLFPREEGPKRQGEAHVFHKDGWTALAFTDRSVDSRPGSWSVYCIPETLDGPDALDVARAAFPPIFARYTFDVEVATG